MLDKFQGLTPLQAALAFQAWLCEEVTMLDVGLKQISNPYMVVAETYRLDIALNGELQFTADIWQRDSGDFKMAFSVHGSDACTRIVSPETCKAVLINRCIGRGFLTVPSPPPEGV